MFYIRVGSKMAEFPTDLCTLYNLHSLPCKSSKENFILFYSIYFNVFLNLTFQIRWAETLSFWNPHVKYMVEQVQWYKQAFNLRLKCFLFIKWNKQAMFPNFLPVFVLVIWERNHISFPTSSTLRGLVYLSLFYFFSSFKFWPTSSVYFPGCWWLAMICAELLQVCF